MKNYFKPLLVVLLPAFIVSCNDEKVENEGTTTGNLYISEAKPHPGDMIRLKYNLPEGEETQPKVSMNYMLHDRMYPLDIQMNDSSGVMIGQVKIPDSAQAVAFNFNTEGHYDNNHKKGYAFPLYTEEGEPVKGSSASLGSYYYRNGERYGIQVEEDSALAMISGDLDHYPDLVETYDRSYPNMILQNDRKKGMNYVDKRIDYYNQKDSLNQDNYRSIISLYELKKDKAKTDSVRGVAISKYPKGDIAKSKYSSDFYYAKDLDKRQEIYDEYNEKIGEDGSQKDFMLRYLASGYADAGDYDKAMEYAEKISDASSRASLYNHLAWNLAEKGENLDKADTMAGKAVAIVQEQQGQSEKPEYYSENQYKQMLESDLSMYRDTYGYVKFKEGDVKKALDIQEKAVSENSGADVNTRYVQFLLENEKYQEAQEKAEKFLKENRAADMMKQYLATAYEKNKGSKEGYDQYFASIEKVSKENAMKDLKRDMLDEEAPKFTMKDLEGNEIALADLQGKTVILDFWATWCGPCKASFPGMKTAVEKFDDNPNVKFLFVDTFENQKEREKEVSDFIDQHDYPFHVVLDQSTDGSDSYPTASDYGITGIPTKVVIGPDGNIKFKVIGYGGNNEQMVKEIGYMIELTQNKKQPEA